MPDQVLLFTILCLFLILSGFNINHSYHNQMALLMNKDFYVLVLFATVPGSCSSSKTTRSGGKNELNVSMGLVNVVDDKVKVMYRPASINSATITYQLPNVIPGTDAVANFKNIWTYCQTV